MSAVRRSSSIGRRSVGSSWVGPVTGSSTTSVSAVGRHARPRRRLRPVERSPRAGRSRRRARSAPTGGQVPSRRGTRSPHRDRRSRSALAKPPWCRWSATGRPISPMVSVVAMTRPTTNHAPATTLSQPPSIAVARLRDRTSSNPPTIATTPGSTSSQPRDRTPRRTLIRVVREVEHRSEERDQRTPCPEQDRPGNHLPRRDCAAMRILPPPTRSSETTRVIEGLLIRL